MSNTYKSGSHSKYLLQYHLIFVCKYRRKLLSSSNIASDIKRLSIEYCQKHNVVIHYMETDKDHIHYMIETTPNINLSNMVKTMKSYITYHIWEKYSAYLSKCFWKERTFFSDGCKNPRIFRFGERQVNYRNERRPLSQTGSPKNT